MSLVTIAVYRSVTGDTATASGTVQDWLDDTEQDLAEFLDRPLDGDGVPTIAHGTFTERLRIIAGHRGPQVFPRGTPITDPGDYTQHGNALTGATATGGLIDVSDPAYATVTYSGGWTATTLPRCIRNDICWAAREGIRHEAPVAAGAVSVSLGDASVSYGAQGGRRAAEDARWSRQTRRYRRRHQ